MTPTDNALVRSNCRIVLKVLRARNSELSLTRISNIVEGQITSWFSKREIIKIEMIKNNKDYKNKLVYVLNKDSKPLMPCKIIKARHLLKSKKAKIVRYEPFTIQLLFECEDEVQELVLGVDSGSKEIGLSVVSKDKELYSAEAKLRNDIVKLIANRRQLRRNRRSHKTRYREARFDNRKRKDNWLAPSIRSKISSHLQLVKKVNDILPINKTIVEVASFDIQKIKHPIIEGVGYQQGEQMNFWNVREYVLWRDNHKCQSRQKCSDPILNVHHVESRQTGGNAPNNLITLCKECHADYHAGKLVKEFKRGQSFRNEAFMGIMRWRLYNELKEIYPNVNLTYGYLTKSIRIANKLEKSHRNDALCISGNPNVEKVSEWWKIKQVRKKKRSLHEVDPRKGGKRKVRNVKQIIHKEKLWVSRDKIELNNKVGWITGFTNKYVYVKDIDNNCLQQSSVYKQINPSKLKLINRNNNWIYETIQNKRARPNNKRIQ